MRTESQRAAIAAELANLKHGQRADRVEVSIETSTLGEPNIKGSIEAFNEDTKKEGASIEAPSPVTQEKAAKLLNVSKS